MKGRAVFAIALSTTMAQLHATLLPTEGPLITRDPWQCVLDNMTSYFRPPQPTGNLATALVSYGGVLLDEICPPEQPICPFPAQSRWCAFTDVAPRTLLADWSSYGSMANEWIASRSSTMIELAVQCPNYWYKAMNQVPLGKNHLNSTITFAGCYAEAQTTSVPDSQRQAAPATPASGIQSEEPRETGSLAVRSYQTDGVVAGL
ncbi:hypothetical protein BDZ85DRAFT_278505 [Elsinoe ampelina]|uniref:DUF7735 domain-containing protein n=1 Tax=Elsinoe ampelina TaxID=302913 RepID=A0A6A6GM05_9PEZI|nr:hypothetical protein BDZ85DRAFT_278505 [Elsinoe ampelina]